MTNQWGLPEKNINGVLAVEIGGKWYPYSLIVYLSNKPQGFKYNPVTKTQTELSNNPATFSTKYIDEMKDVIKEAFEKGTARGWIASFYPDAIPVYEDLAKAKGYKLENVHTTDSGVMATITKIASRKPKQSKTIKRNPPKCRCKK